MGNGELEQIIKVNDTNKMEKVKLEERLSNLQSEQDKLHKQLDEMGIPVEEASMILQELMDEYDKLIKEANKALGIA